MIEPKSRGVLDPRMRGDDSCVRKVTCALLPQNTGWPPAHPSAKTRPPYRKLEGQTDEHSSRQYAFWCGQAGQAFGRPAALDREGAVHRRQAGRGRAVAARVALAA